MIFSLPTISPQDTKIIDEIGKIQKSLQYAFTTPKRWYGSLRRSTFARAVRGSNSIEGYVVSKEDAVAAVEGDENFDAQKETRLAILGYRNAMTYVLQRADDPHFTYTEDLIKSLHFMMLQHELNKNPGKWRPGPIYVRNEATAKNVYEGPPAEKVPELMQAFVQSLNELEPSVPAMLRAAMAHLNLVMIHPFSDGNGRMGRCLQTLVLAREKILHPQFCSIEEYLGSNTRSYYDVLAEVGQGNWNPHNNTHPWIVYCLTAHYRQANTLLRRTKEMSKLWDELERLIKEKHLPERTIFALSDAAFGYRVRNSTYRPIAEVSGLVASRDFNLLVEANLLKAVGEKRGRFYEATNNLIAIRDKAREPRHDDDPYEIIKVTDPFLPGMEPK
jgi:Fic family protein